MWRVLAVLVLMAMVLPAVPAQAACPSISAPVEPFQAPDTSPGTVSFVGGGWGHGVGMSQYGARNAADMGCSHTQILAGYYPGTTTTSQSTLKAPRVGLRVGNSINVATSTITNTGTDPVQWTMAGTQIHLQAPGTAVKVVQTSPGPRLRLEPAGGGAPLWTQPTSGPTTLSVTLSPPGAASSTRELEISGKTSGGRQIPYSRGTYRVESGRAGPSDTFQQVIDVTMEDYLLGLNEMPSSWPTEALRAQAVAGRSYAQAVIAPRSGCTCTIWDSTLDQVYGGSLRERDAPTGYQLWKSAVTSTASRVQVHNGTVIPTFYSSSNGGVSMVDGLGRPYLPGQNTSGWDNAATGNSRHRWTSNFSVDQITDEFELDTLTAIETDLTSVGRVYEITFIGTDTASAPREITVRGRDLRTRLGLYSDFYAVTYTPRENPWRFDQFVATDIDGDGRDEFTFHDRAAGLIQVFAGGTTKDLGPPVADIPGLWPGWTGLAACDLDGNGDDEWLFHHRPSQVVAVYPGTSAHRLGSRIGTLTIPTRWATVGCGDVYPGGGEELLLHDPVSGQVAIHMASASAVGAQLSILDVGTDVSLARLVDVEGDRRAELLTYDDQSGRLMIRSLTEDATLAQTQADIVVASGWDEIVPTRIEAGGGHQLMFSRPAARQIVSYRLAVTPWPGDVQTRQQLGTNWDVMTAAPISDADRSDIVFHRTATGSTLVYATDESGAISQRLSGVRYAPGWNDLVPIRTGTATTMLFHRADVGSLVVYSLRPDGRIKTKLSGYRVAPGWSQILAVDVDNDGTDELLFHRASTGQILVYDLAASGRLGNLMSSYRVAAGWDNLVAIDIDGDGARELTFHRHSNGRTIAYHLRNDGRLGSSLSPGALGGDRTSLTAAQRDADASEELVSYGRDNGIFEVATGEVIVGLGSRITGYDLP